MLEMHETMGELHKLGLTDCKGIFNEISLNFIKAMVGDYTKHAWRYNLFPFINRGMVNIDLTGDEEEEAQPPSTPPPQPAPQTIPVQQGSVHLIDDADDGYIEIDLVTPEVIEIPDSYDVDFFRDDLLSSTPHTSKADDEEKVLYNSGAKFFKVLANLRK